MSYCWLQSKLQAAVTANDLLHMVEGMRHLESSQIPPRKAQPCGLGRWSNRHAPLT